MVHGNIKDGISSNLYSQSIVELTFVPSSMEVKQLVGEIQTSRQTGLQTDTE